VSSGAIRSATGLGCVTGKTHRCNARFLNHFFDSEGMRLTLSGAPSLRICLEARLSPCADKVLNGVSHRFLKSIVDVFLSCLQMLQAVITCTIESHNCTTRHPISRKSNDCIRVQGQTCHTSFNIDIRVNASGRPFQEVVAPHEIYNMCEFLV